MSSSQHQLPDPTRHSDAPTARRGRGMPLLVATATVIAFLIFWLTTTLLVALILGALTLTAGIVLLVLMFGTPWHRAASSLWRNR
jgi:high-affinity Fe2+/Pb2+ permease